MKKFRKNERELRVLENNFGLIDLRKYHEVARKSLEKYRLKPKDFLGPYPAYEINQDEKTVEKLKEKMENNDKETQKQNPYHAEHAMLAKILEYILYMGLELSEWLGKDGFTGVTSEFDDYINKTDLFFELDESTLLAIDATSSSNKEILKEKIKKIFDKDFLTEIKYFSSSYKPNEKEKKEGVPRIIIGAQKNTIAELFEMLRAKNNQSLANHNIQFQVLEQAIAQLFIAEKYRESQNKNTSDITPIKKKLKKILKEKKQNIQPTGLGDNSSWILIHAFIDELIDRTLQNQDTESQDNKQDNSMEEKNKLKNKLIEEIQEEINFKN